MSHQHSGSTWNKADGVMSFSHLPEADSMAGDPRFGLQAAQSASMPLALLWFGVYSSTMSHECSVIPLPWGTAVGRELSILLQEVLSASLTLIKCREPGAAQRREASLRSAHSLSRQDGITSRRSTFTLCQHQRAFRVTCRPGSYRLHWKTRVPPNAGAPPAPYLCNPKSFTHRWPMAPGVAQETPHVCRKCPLCCSPGRCGGTRCPEGWGCSRCPRTPRRPAICHLTKM